MDLLRIGDKVISRSKIRRCIERALELRVAGRSQQEAAEALGVDRSFISRLEALGEVRRGGSLALIGFPLANTDEVRRVAEEEGVDYVLVMNDEERWRFVRDRNGLEVFNDVMQIIYRLQEFDTVIFLGSDFRLDLAYRILGNQHVVGIELGESPIRGDRTVDSAELRRLIRTLKGRKGRESEGEGSGIE